MAKSNLHQVADQMQESKYGALSQAFIMEAIDRYAKEVAEADMSKQPKTFINLESWQGVANEWNASRKKVLAESGV